MLDSAPPIQAACGALSDNVMHLPALIAAICACAGIDVVPVVRPLVGVALLPDDANPLLTAQAIDAEQVTAGYLDYTGRVCATLFADSTHIEQVAHNVAKVVHLLCELYTGFIYVQNDACPLPKLVASEAEVAANAVLEAVSALDAEIAALEAF